MRYDISGARCTREHTHTRQSVPWLRQRVCSRQVTRLLDYRLKVKRQRGYVTTIKRTTRRHQIRRRRHRCSSSSRHRRHRSGRRRRRLRDCVALIPSPMLSVDRSKCSCQVVSHLESILPSYLIPNRWNSHVRLTLRRYHQRHWHRPYDHRISDIQWHFASITNVWIVDVVIYESNDNVRRRRSRFDGVR